MKNNVLIDPVGGADYLFKDKPKNGELPLEPKVDQTHLQCKQDMEMVMATVQGRRFVWNWLLESGLFKKTFVGNATSSYNEGMREHALIRHASLRENVPKLFCLMYLENFLDKDGRLGLNPNFAMTHDRT